MMKSNEVFSTPFFTESECEEIVKYIDKKKNYLLDNKKQYEEIGDSSYNQSQITTSNYNNYNFFLDNPKYIDRFLKTLNSFLPELEYPIAVQSWVNVYEKGDGIGIHNHSGMNLHSFAANIFIDGPTKPGITYIDISGSATLENIKGEMQLFNCSLYHEVPKNISDTARYSIGITIHGHEAITRGLLSNASFNSNRSIIILNQLT